MSKVKTDRIQPNLLPITVHDGLSSLETFIAAEGQQTFTSTQFDSDTRIAVYVDLVRDDGAYWSNGQTITISNAATAGQTIHVYGAAKWIVNGQGVNKVRSFIGDGVTVSYDLGFNIQSKNYVDLYIGGVYQSKATYEVSGTAVTLSTAAPDLSSIEFVYRSLLPSAMATDASLVSYEDTTVEQALLDVESAIVATNDDLSLLGDDLTNFQTNLADGSLPGASLVGYSPTETVKQKLDDLANKVVVASTLEAQAGTSNTTLMTPLRTKEWGSANVLGMGQTWQDVKSSRLVNTVYQNTTGRPIEWSLSGGGPVAIGGTPMMQVSSNGVNWVTVASYSDDAANQGSAVIPPLWYYRTQNINLVVHWTELR
jgi:hypothetical protein